LQILNIFFFFFAHVKFCVFSQVRPLGKTVSSAYSPDTLPGGVIQRVVFTEHKRNLSRAGFWFDSERVLHQYTNEAPFCLTKLQVLQNFCC
jgi:hypothetical protein